jgi:carbonic anhydrase
MPARSKPTSSTSRQAGELTVLDVLIDAGVPNAAFQQVLDAMPEEQGTVHSWDIVDAAAFVPDDLTHYAYDDSLTTLPLHRRRR